MTIKLSELKVKSYKLPAIERGGVVLESVGQVDGSELWAIRKGGECLNKSLEWEYEPMPSNRTKSFYRRCRWDTPEKAIKSWEKYLKMDGRP